MAFINLSGTLLDPNGTYAAGDRLRFTHLSTTGQTVAGAISIEEIGLDGTYSFSLEYGEILVEYRDALAQSWERKGAVVVNSDQTATTIPQLLNAVVPPTDDQLLQFQAIQSDAAASASASASSASSSAASASAAANSAVLANSSAQLMNEATFEANRQIAREKFDYKSGFVASIGIQA